MTDAQFQTAQDMIDQLVRDSRRGKADKAIVDAIHAEWEAAIALPQVKFVDRKVRDAALLAVAVKHGLVQV